MGNIIFYIGVVSFIGMLGILASLWEKKRNIKLAEKDIAELTRSLRAYIEEYDGLPITNYSEDEQSFREVLDVLSGKKWNVGAPISQNVEILNPKLINFIEKLLGRTSINGMLVDPWNQPYRIAFDTNDDLIVELEKHTGDSITKRYIHAPFVIWSCGPDKQNDLGNGDDIESWYIRNDDPTSLSLRVKKDKPLFED